MKILLLAALTMGLFSSSYAGGIKIITAKKEPLKKIPSFKQMRYKNAVKPSLKKQMPRAKNMGYVLKKNSEKNKVEELKKHFNRDTASQNDKAEPKREILFN